MQKCYFFEAKNLDQKKVVSLQRISRIRELANSYQTNRVVTEG